jgi:rhomboid protease GluP
VFKRKTSGSVLCSSCGVLVGVGDDRCYNCGRRNPALWGWAPALRELGGDMGFAPFVIGACSFVYALTLIFSIGSVGVGGLGLLSPSSRALLLFGASGALPIFVADRWWTVLSAAWLHGGLLHIFMNMMALRQIAPGVAELYGPARTVIIYTAGSVVGFALSSFAGAFIPPILILQGSTITVGASASIAGLIGAILAYGHQTGSTMARSYAGSYIVGLVVIGFLPFGIDNYAHAGGFAGGYLTARLLNPMKSERVDHVIVALACVGVSLLSIVVSVIHGAPLLRP